MTIRGDSVEYELLKKWCDDLKLTPEILTCEIGIREGLGSKIILESIKERLRNMNYNMSYFRHIGIDPYNNLKYQHYDNSPSYTSDYTNEMCETMRKDFKNEKNFEYYQLDDKTFMELHSSAWTMRNFNLVHFDGPHMTRDVISEAVWFADRSVSGTRFIFDDYKKYDSDTLIKMLSYYRFKVLESGNNKLCLEKE